MKWMRRAVLPLVLAACGSSHERGRERHNPDGRAEQGTRPADAGSRKQTSVLPEDGPHPDYPTPRRAGTDELFFLEEPVRGPHVTAIAMPDRKQLAFKRHAYCEIDEVTVVCGDEPPSKKDATGVSVGRKAGRPVLVEWMRGDQVDLRVILEYDAGGTVVRMARLDEDGDLEWTRTYDPPGRRYTARNLDGSNALDGCGAMDLGVDTSGGVNTTSCLQWVGDPMRDTNGVTTTRLRRDAAGFVIEAERLGPDGKPLEGQQDSVHRIVTARDSRGRPIRERYFDRAGTSVGSDDEEGCRGTDIEYARNQTRRSRCVDQAGTLTGDEDGVAITETERDAQGCAVATRYLDVGGKPTASDGVHVRRDQVDARCRAVVTSCHDAGNALVQCAPGAPAEYRYKLDAHGNVVATTYRDAYGSASLDPAYGVAEVRSRWDDLGRETEQACFGETGYEIECGGTGFHRYQDTYDGNGRALERRFFDTNGTATTNLGTVRRSFIYDNYDHLSESKNLDEDGGLIETAGMATRRVYYDDSHRMFGFVLLDQHGRPASYTSCFTAVECPTEAWHAMRVIRSPTGDVTENRYFDASGQPVLSLDCRVSRCWGD